MKVPVKIMKLTDDVVIPAYKRPGDAGMDVRAREAKVLQPGERHLFKLGFRIELPEGYVALMWPRSGLAVKKGLDTLAGVIDHTYRGEYGVPVVNHDSVPHEIVVGERIAQLLIQPICTAKIEIVEELSETVRAEGGFGSSGRT